MIFPEIKELMQLRYQARGLNLTSKRKSLALLKGDMLSPFKGQGLEFEEVREYSHGDDVRNIDWRVTARTNRPHIKVFTEERERSIILCVEANQALQFGTRVTFKSVQAAKITAILGWAGNNENEKVGAFLFGDTLQNGEALFTPTKSRKSLWRAFDCLVKPKVEDSNSGVMLNASKGDDFGGVDKVDGGSKKVGVVSENALITSLLKLRKISVHGSLVFVIADFNQLHDDEEWREMERHLRGLAQKCEVVIITLDDDADKNFPAIEGLKLNFQGEEISWSGITKNQLQEYNQSWKERRKKLKVIAGKYRVRLLEISTKDNVYKTLLSGLHGRIKRSVDNE